ncbi:Hypothetical protein A7982_00251 [Minicystis rosea]|nr:Hypothetical protein A7982_00251 [Minicystis rosea]
MSSPREALCGEGEPSLVGPRAALQTSSSSKAATLPVRAMLLVRS